MKRKTIKAKLAAVLSASMAFTMLAPAMPAYAADATIIFDFDTNTPSLDPGIAPHQITHQITVSGPLGALINTNSAGLQTDTNGVFLPWGNGATAYPTQPDGSGYTGTVGGKTWGTGGLDLKGYKIRGFRKAAGNGDFPRPYLDSKRYQNTTYYATLIADENIPSAMKLSETHVKDTSDPSTTYFPSPNNTPVQYPVLKDINERPKEIPGYVVSGLTVSGDGMASVAKQAGLTLTAGATSLSVPNPYVLNFKTTNKDVNIEYKYKVSDDKFSLKVVDTVWNNIGSAAHPARGTLKSQNQRPIPAVSNKQVLTSVDAAGIKVNSKYVHIASPAPSTPSRYILDPDNPVTIKYDWGTPNSTSGKFTTAKDGTSGDILNIIPAKDDTDYRCIKVGNAASGYEITGQIPNQGVTVTYNYYENPDYYTLINVKYVDNEGKDIFNKVKAANTSAFIDISTVVPPAEPNIGVMYTDGDHAYMRVKNTSTSIDYDIPVPVLNDYISAGTDISKLPTITTDKLVDWNSSYTYIYTNPAGRNQTAPNANQAGWSATNPKYTVSIDKDGDGTGETPLSSASLVVTYTIDPNKVANVAAIGVGTGDLYTDGGPATGHIYGTLPTDIKQLSRKPSTVANHYSLEIQQSDLPTPVPATGYRFAGWKYNGTDITSFPATIDVPNSENNASIIGTFEKNENQWNEYKLATGNSHVRLLGGDKATVVNVGSGGNSLNSIPFSAISSYTQGMAISVDPGYTVEWHTQSDTVLNSNSNIAGMNGQTFTAFGVSTAPEAVYTPTITGDLNNAGKPVITIDPLLPAAMDSRLKYVVTDADGNVVAVVPGSKLMVEGGNIMGDFLTPGNTYNVATALSTTPIAGSPIPFGAAGISAISTTQIPVALTPQVIEDPSNPGRASITITPTATNTEYALVDDNGNEVYPFTTPTNDTSGVGSVTFGNLNPGTTYHVVPRPIGSSDTPAQRQASGADLPVATNNFGLSVNTFDVTVIANNAPLPANFKIGGQTETDINKLRNLAPGTAVEILAQPLDNAANTFKEWKVINGDFSGTTNARITFTMPNKPVKIQAIYDVAGLDWDNNVYNDNIASGKHIGVVNPIVSDTGRFRVIIDKDSVSNPLKALVEETLTDHYHPIFAMTARLQKLDVATNVWEDYPGDIDLDTTVETGALLSTRDYTLHELATGSNAAMAVSGDFENPTTTYPGQFDITLKSGKTYIFGYTTPAIYKIKVRDNRDNDLITTLTLRSTETVQDKASLYSHKITSDYIDNNGITWHYEGLSTDKDTYQDYDPTFRVTSDETVYVFYSNDKAERAKAEKDLKSAVSAARNNLNNYDAPSQALLLAQLADAQAILDRINRKSSTSELEAALDALNNLLATLQPRKSGGGGGGRGGSGGGSGSAGKKSTGQNSGIRVGLDGNWELTNPAEAQANPDGSKWKFNLTNGGSVTGWAYLTYTYEGRTKSEWYHFGNDSIMDSGWFLDTNSNTWYYLSMDHDGFFGEMVKGWHYDGQDGRWYYLDPNSGAMHTGWSKIGGEFYYLNPTAPAQTWFFDNATGRWNFGDIKSRPLGSMYQNESTPDGYHVNESGAWR
ncbi:N-acetylmuramoyl-L-alanine amidase family protein [Lachnoanaerobaculum umeaense]|nr:hypothetical protein [Lachnoanaerobaculum umeaense]PZW91962.1 hypothetical protein C7439_13713 [Lachnoanaerobaculum umeaense]